MIIYISASRIGDKFRCPVIYPMPKVLSADEKGITVNGSNIVGPRPNVHRVTDGVQIDGANGSEIVKDGPKGDPGRNGRDVDRSVIQSYENRLASVENYRGHFDQTLNQGQKFVLIDTPKPFYVVICVNGSADGGWDRIIFDVNRYPDNSVKIDSRLPRGNSEKGTINMQSSGNQVYLTHSFAYGGRPIRVYGSYEYIYKA